MFKIGLFNSLGYRRRSPLTVIQASGLKDLPTLSLFMADSGQPARVHMKGAIPVERGSRDTAQDGCQRELMADHDDPLICTMALDDPFDTPPRPLLDIAETLSSRNYDVSGVPPPEINKLRIGLPDLNEGEAFEVSMVQLAEIAVGDYIQSVRFPDGMGGLDGPFQIAGVDGVKFLHAKGSGYFPGLF